MLIWTCIYICNTIAAMTYMWILWALLEALWLSGYWALDLSLVVPGSALHPIAHCFVLGCPKFNSQAVLVKSLLVCPLASWDLCFCNVYLQFVWIGPEKPYWGSGQWLLNIIMIEIELYDNENAVRTFSRNLPLFRITFL